MAKGKQLLEKEAAKKGVPISELVKPEILQPILRRYNMMDWDAACAACGHGGIREAQFINRLYDEYIRITNPDANLTRKPMRNRDVADEILNLISVTGIDSPRVILARCCNPQPGNAVKANHTRGRNVTIHRHNCPNIAPEKLDRNRVLDAQWPVLITKSPEPAMLMVNYKVNITITAFNQNKLLHDITGVLYKEKANIYSCSAVPDEEDDSRGFIDLKFEVQNPIVYESVIKQLRKVNGIIDITRK
jgi:GTP pyrophosphokinase